MQCHVVASRMALMHNLCVLAQVAIPPDDIDTKLHTGVGDAIVFDSRLLHRGIEKKFGNHKRTLHGRHRIGISLSFGKKGVFSDVFDRGFAMRGKLYSHNSSICRNEWSKRDDVSIGTPCVLRAIKTDIARYATAREWCESGEGLYPTMSDVSGRLRELESMVQPSPMPSYWLFFVCAGIAVAGLAICCGLRL